MRWMRIFPEIWARTSRPASSSTRKRASGRVSLTIPLSSALSFFPEEKPFVFTISILLGQPARLPSFAPGYKSPRPPTPFLRKFGDLVPPSPSKESGDPRAGLSLLRVPPACPPGCNRRPRYLSEWQRRYRECGCPPELRQLPSSAPLLRPEGIWSWRAALSVRRQCRPSR